VAFWKTRGLPGLSFIKQEKIMADTEIDPWASNITLPIAASVVIAKPRTSSSPWARTIGRTTHAGTALRVTRNDLIKSQAGGEPIAPSATSR